MTGFAGEFKIVTEIEPDPPQLVAVTVAMEPGPCQRILTAPEPCPAVIVPLVGGVMVQVIRPAPVAEKPVSSSIHTGDEPVTTEGP